MNPIIYAYTNQFNENVIVVDPDLIKLYFWRNYTTRPPPDGDMVGINFRVVLEDPE